MFFDKIFNVSGNQNRSLSFSWKQIFSTLNATEHLETEENHNIWYDSQPTSLWDDFDQDEMILFILVSHFALNILQS